MQKYFLRILSLTLFCIFTTYSIEQPELLDQNFSIEINDLYDLQKFIQSTSFVQLIESFMSIFQKTFIACSQLTLDATLTDESFGISQQDIMNIIEQNPAIKEEILCLLKRHSHLFVVTKGPKKEKHKAMEKADREDIHKILMSFAGIMQCFFRIIQDPDNKDHITHELLGILANLLQASKVIMKKNVITEDIQASHNVLTIFSAIPQN